MKLTELIAKLNEMENILEVDLECMACGKQGTFAEFMLKTNSPTVQLQCSHCNAGEHKIHIVMGNN